MSSSVTAVAGNLTTDPQAYETQNGRKVMGFGVAIKRRVNLETGVWEEVDETLFVRCSVWGHQGANVAESLLTGNRVVLIGQLELRRYTPRGGSEVRETVQLSVSEIASSLLYAAAKPVKRSGRRGGGD